MSVWAKAGEYTGVSLTIADTSNNQNGVRFDLSAGTFSVVMVIIMVEWMHIQMDGIDALQH